MEEYGGMEACPQEKKLIYHIFGLLRTSYRVSGGLPPEKKIKYTIYLACSEINTGF